MQKLDRLGWAAGFSFAAYGLRIGIRVNDAELLTSIPACLPPRWSVSSAATVDRLYSLICGDVDSRSGVRRFHLAYAGAQRIARSLNLAEVLDALDLDIQFYLACQARRGLFVHAGVVAYDGQGIVIPGRSCTGKTSLVAELVRAGATYYSDEFAIIDRQGRVAPYAKPLSIREPPHGKPRKQPVESLGGEAGLTMFRPRLIVVSKYQPGARWRPRRLSAGRGILALLDNTVSVRRQPLEALSRLSQTAASAVVLKGPRGEAREAAQAILQSLAA